VTGLECLARLLELPGRVAAQAKHRAGRPGVKWCGVAIEELQLPWVSTGALMLRPGARLIAGTVLQLSAAGKIGKPAPFPIPARMFGPTATGRESAPPDARHGPAGSGGRGCGMRPGPGQRGRGSSRSRIRRGFCIGWPICRPQERIPATVFTGAHAFRVDARNGRQTKASGPMAAETELGQPRCTQDVRKSSRAPDPIRARQGAVTKPVSGLKSQLETELFPRRAIILVVEVH